MTISRLNACSACHSRIPQWQTSSALVAMSIHTSARVTSVAYPTTRAQKDKQTVLPLPRVLYTAYPFIAQRGYLINQVNCSPMGSTTARVNLYGNTIWPRWKLLVDCKIRADLLMLLHTLIDMFISNNMKIATSTISASSLSCFLPYTLVCASSYLLFTSI